MQCFFFNDTATTEIYTLSLHDALPILAWEEAASYGLTFFTAYRMLVDQARLQEGHRVLIWGAAGGLGEIGRSTRLNSSHANISYAVFCLKKINNLYDCIIYVTSSVVIV